MAYHKSVFNGNAPGMGFMTRSLWPYVIAVLLLIPVYQFTSGYLHAKFGKEENKSALIGQWVGLVQLQPLDGTHQSPSEEHGGAVMSIIITPVMLSYLSKLRGTAELTDYEYHVKGMETATFMTPFNPAEGRFTVRTAGTKGDDALTGTLEGRFDRDTLTIRGFATPEFFITGILRRGDDQIYKRRVQAMKDMPTTPTLGGQHGR